MSLGKSVLTIYNPRNEDPKELINNFVIRNKEYENIIEDIKSSEMKYPEQNYIIQGQRGYGKTTLLLRLYYEILEDETLNKKIFPIIFTEEQYNIRTLSKLWEHIADYLEEDQDFKGIYDQLKNLNKGENYETQCFDILKKYLIDNNKKIILFIDNIGSLFDKFTDKENHRLREILLTSPEIRIIGGAAEILEHTYDYSKPFFDFFKIITLKGLNKKDTETLLLKLSKKFGQEEKTYIEDIIENHSGRIESLRRLTGGVPRTIVLLFEVFIDNKGGNSFEDLEMVLDRVTPLYKHRMDDLKTNQQAIVDVIAMSWDAVSTKFISEETGMPSKIVSAQLNELEKNKIIQKIETSTKNHLYQILERFFNIWYLMRYGRKKDKSKVQWLVQFLEIWCDKNELNKRATKHLELIKQGKLNDKYALHITEAYIRTKLDIDLQDELINSTKELLKIKSKHLIRDLSISDKELVSKALHSLKEDDFKNALSQFNQIKNKGTSELIIIQAIKNILNENETSQASSVLATLCDIEYKRPDLSEKYYLMAINQGHLNVSFNLALLYQSQYKDYDLAIKYYLISINQGDSKSMFNLARLYHTEYKDYALAEKYYLMSIDYGESNAVFNIAVLYHIGQENYVLAEKYYLMSISQGHLQATSGLGLLYELDYKNYDLAEKYYLMAINNGDLDVVKDLFKLYYVKSFNKLHALKYSKEIYDINKNLFNLFFVCISLLWNDKIKDSMQEFEELLTNKAFIDSNIDLITEFMMLLVAKKQYNYAYKVLLNDEYDFKNILKPIYYALISFMQDQYPDEYKKMGDELKLTVEEIIAKINRLAVDYV